MGEITRESSCLTRDVSAEEFPHAAPEPAVNGLSGK